MNIKSEVKQDDGTTLVTFEDGTTEVRPADTNNSGEKDVATLVKEAVEAQLADIKSKLNNAYAERDEAKKLAKKMEDEARAANIKRLEDEGKIAEAANLRLTEVTAENERLKKVNTELSRDVQVRDALKGLDFRNDVAAEMGYSQIVSQLIQNSEGKWIHKSGVSIHEFVGQFAKDENQSFLFKPKTSSGSGAPTGGGAPAQSTSGKKLSELPQAEVIARAARGEFGPIPQF